MNTNTDKTTINNPATNAHDVANTEARIKNEVKLAEINLERLRIDVKVRPWIFAGFMALLIASIIITHLITASWH